MPSPSAGSPHAAARASHGIVGAVNAALDEKHGGAEVLVTGWVLVGGVAPAYVGLRSGGFRKRVKVDRDSPDIRAQHPQAADGARCRFSGRIPVAQVGAAGTIEAFVPVAGGKVVHLGSAAVRTGTVTAPIFIVGSPRSGTTALGSALRRTLQWRGFGECHVAGLLPSLLDTVRRYYDDPNNAEASRTEGVMLAKLPQAEVAGRLHNLFRELYRELHEQAGFIDKTPGPAMIRALPSLLKVWPQARVIHARRRGIENVDSRLRKFPSLGFADHCRNWAETMKLWSRVSRSLPAGCAIEVDQFDFAHDPGAVARKLGEFLPLPPDRVAALERHLGGSAPEKTGGDAAWQAKELDSMGWSAEQRALFRDVCGPVMADFGYSFTDSYYEARAATAAS